MAKILGLYKEPTMNTSTPAIMLRFMSTSLSDQAESLTLQQVVEQEPKRTEEK